MSVLILLRDALLLCHRELQTLICLAVFRQELLLETRNLQPAFSALFGTVRMFLLALVLGD